MSRFEWMADNPEKDEDYPFLNSLPIVRILKRGPVTREEAADRTVIWNQPSLDEALKEASRRFDKKSATFSRASSDQVAHLIG